MWTVNFQMFKLDLEKAEEPEIKLPTSVWSLKKQQSSRQIPTSILLTMPKPLTLWIRTVWKILQEIGIVDHLTCLLRNLYANLYADWCQIRKGVHQSCILSPCLFNLYANTSCEMLGWMKHKLESRLPGEISITSDMQMAPPLWQKVKS